MYFVSFTSVSQHMSELYQQLQSTQNWLNFRFLLHISYSCWGHGLTWTEMHAYKVRAVRAVRAVRHRFHDQWLLITEDRMTFPILPTMMAVEELPKEMLDGNSAWLTLVKNAYEYSSDIIYTCAS